MKNKSLWKISVLTTLEAEDAVAELLSGIFNGTASAYFDFEKNESRVAVFISKIILREEREKIRGGLKRIRNCGLKIGAGKIKIGKMRREKWAESWKRHFKPIEIDDSLLIKPGWSKKRPRKNQKAVVLDPGLSFGTGQHPTTKFCLRQICSVGVVRQSSNRRLDATKSFLDIGTGSGILAIAAAKLDFQPILAIDFDAEAIRVAKGNARANGVLKKIKSVRADVKNLSAKPKKQFDLVCANLISDLLIVERKRIVAQLNHDGALVLAGILKSEFSKVRRAFEELGLKLISAESENEWRSGSFIFC